MHELGQRPATGLQEPEAQRAVGRRDPASDGPAQRPRRGGGDHPPATADARIAHRPAGEPELLVQHEHDRHEHGVLHRVAQAPPERRWPSPRSACNTSVAATLRPEREQHARHHERREGPRRDEGEHATGRDHAGEQGRPVAGQPQRQREGDRRTVRRWGGGHVPRQQRRTAERHGQRPERHDRQRDREPAVRRGAEDARHHRGQQDEGGGLGDLARGSDQHGSPNGRGHRGRRR